MTVAIDQSTIGGSTNAAGTSSQAFTTTVPVASGGFIVVTGGWFSTGAMSSVSGGSLTWAIDNSGNPAIASAQAPSGLPSGTTITANFSPATGGDLSLAGLSFTGVAASSALDTTTAANGFSATTAWATSAATILAGSVLIGASYTVTNPTTSTATLPSIEAFDQPVPGDVGFTAAYRIESSAGSYTVAGTWSGSATGNATSAAYKQAAGAAAAAPILRTFNAIPFMTGVL